MVVLATINGCRVRVLLDSGCTSELIIDERAAGRVGVNNLRPSRDVILGDGTPVSTKEGEATITVDGYMCRAPCKVMKLSDHFDVVLGKPWLARV